MTMLPTNSREPRRRSWWGIGCLIVLAIALTGLLILNVDRLLGWWIDKLGGKA